LCKSALNCVTCHRGENTRIQRHPVRIEIASIGNSKTLREKKEPPPPLWRYFSFG
jgi:hypothetical protein